MATKVITGKVRASFVHIFEPQSVNGSDPRYSCSFIIPKSDAETIGKIRAAIEEAKQSGVTKWGGKIPPSLKLPLRDGDIERPDDPAYLAAFDRLMANTSLVILDLKEIDPERHRQLTGKDNANILAMARHISDLGIPLWVRHVLVPGLTDDEEGLRRTADFIRSLKTVQRVEVLPYHTLGLFKWQKLGIPYPLPDAVPPTAEQVKRAEELLEVNRYPG